MRSLRYVSLLVILTMITLPACTGIHPSLVKLQWSYAGGVVKGTITNQSTSTISSTEVEVQVVGDKDQVLSTLRRTISRTVRPGETEEFELQVGVAGGRTARLSVRGVS